MRKFIVVLLFLLMAEKSFAEASIITKSLENSLHHIQTYLIACTGSEDGMDGVRVASCLAENKEGFLVTFSLISTKANFGYSDEKGFAVSGTEIGRDYYKRHVDFDGLAFIKEEENEEVLQDLARTLIHEKAFITEVLSCDTGYAKKSNAKVGVCVARVNIKEYGEGFINIIYFEQSPNKFIFDLTPLYGFEEINFSLKPYSEYKFTDSTYDYNQYYNNGKSPEELRREATYAWGEGPGVCPMHASDSFSEREPIGPYSDTRCIFAPRDPFSGGYGSCGVDSFRDTPRDSGGHWF